MAETRRYVQGEPFKAYGVPAENAKIYGLRYKIPFEKQKSAPQGANSRSVS